LRSFVKSSASTGVVWRTVIIGLGFWSTPRWRQTTEPRRGNEPPDSLAVAGNTKGANNNNNRATAVNGGTAFAGGSNKGSVTAGNSNNTATALGDGSLAAAGAVGINESGFTADAGPGQTVCSPAGLGCP
jgi:hypothetical protein